MKSSRQGTSIAFCWDVSNYLASLPCWFIGVKNNWNKPGVISLVYRCFIPKAICCPTGMLSRPSLSISIWTGIG